ncbi:hypothetical protein [Lentzea flava]|uniref:hypothetical protein n=1 Tax=Lentzea flava TaxID=103732 RepID=UPI00167050E2|nr:hypothetical protein [Lentzea flava]
MTRTLTNLAFLGESRIDLYTFVCMRALTAGVVIASSETKPEFGEPDTRYSTLSGRKA